MIKSELSIGQRVNFGRKHGQQTLGEVVKVNRTKAKVRQLEARGTMKDHKVGTIWTVPFSMLTPANGAVATPAPQPASRPASTMQDNGDFRLGQEVMFGRRNGQKTRGEVVKINRKTLKVKTLEDRGGKSKVGDVWTVGKGACQAVN